MTASKRPAFNRSSSIHGERPRDLERIVASDGLVFRPEVRMLNGTGPLTAPLRVLYMDGSPESLRAYEACADAGIDFSLVVTEPGEGVFLHDGLLHLDFNGQEAIERGVAFAKDLYSQMEPLIVEALSSGPWGEAWQGDRSVAEAVECEREKREGLLSEAITNYRESRGG